MIANATRLSGRLPGIAGTGTGVGLSLAFGAALAHGSGVGFLALGAGALLVASLAAHVHPVGFFALVGATVAFVPIYASPNLRSLLLEPSAVLLWCLAGVLVLGTSRQKLQLRLSAVDGAAFAFFSLLLVPVLAGQRTVSAYVYTVILWLGPYLGART